MHEYSLTKQIIQIAEKHAKEQNAKKVTAVNLVVGDYSGCTAESIALYFGVFTEATMCSGAMLNIERVEPKLRCKTCGALFERKPFLFDCPEDGCAGEGEPTEIGKEFYIKSIEIES